MGKDGEKKEKKKGIKKFLSRIIRVSVHLYVHDIENIGLTSTHIKGAIPLRLKMRTSIWSNDTR